MVGVSDGWQTLCLSHGDYIAGACSVVPSEGHIFHHQSESWMSAFQALCISFELVSYRNATLEDVWLGGEYYLLVDTLHLIAY